MKKLKGSNRNDGGTGSKTMVGQTKKINIRKFEDTPRRVTQGGTRADGRKRRGSICRKTASVGGKKLFGRLGNEDDYEGGTFGAASKQRET